MSTGIYGIKHRQSGGIYVGHSKTSIERRWTQHITTLQRGTHHCTELQHVWNEDGAAAFEYVILEHITPDNSIDYFRLREQRWIEYLSFDMNIFNKRCELRQVVEDDTT